MSNPSETNKSGKQTKRTKSEKPESTTANTDEGLADAQIHRLMEGLKKVIEFQEQSDRERIYDIIITWDIQLLRGRDTLFTSVEGRSTFPRMLSERMAPLAPRSLQEAIVEKIAYPLIDSFQEEAERQGLVTIAPVIKPAQDALEDEDEPI